MDKYIIFQAIRYYKMVNKYKNLIAKVNSKINRKEAIKVILIAEDYTTDTKNISEFLNIDINFYTYTIYKDEESEGIDIIFNEVETTISEQFEPIENIEIKKIEDHRNYFSTEDLRTLFDKFCKKIKSFNLSIEDYVVQEYVGFKYKGKTIAGIRPRRSFFLLCTSEYDEDGKWLKNVRVKVETGEEEDIEDAYNRMKKLISYKDQI